MDIDNPVENSMMNRMESLIDEMDAEEVAKAEGNEDGKEEEKEEGLPVEEPKEETEEDPAKEPTQADKDREEMAALFAKRSENRAAKQAPKEEQPIAAGKKENLMAKVLSGDMSATNELIDAMGPDAFEKLIKTRLGALESDEKKEEPKQEESNLPESVKKELAENRKFREDMTKWQQQQVQVASQNTMQYQLNLISEAINSDPEYALAKGYEKQIRTLALEFMADGQEKSAADVVRIYTNSLREELLSKKDIISQLLGISQASEKDESKKQTEQKGKSKKTPISNSTETDNTPIEPDDDESMPEDIHSRLEYMIAKARRDKLLE